MLFRSDERSKNPNTIDSISFKVENLEVNVNDDGTIPPLKIIPYLDNKQGECRFPKDMKFNHCPAKTSSRCLSQAIYFADWLASHCDKLGVDLTTSDATACGLMPQDVIINNDTNGCKTRKPDYFINTNEGCAEPKPNTINSPTVNSKSPYYPFVKITARQRMLEYLGSVTIKHPVN